MALQRPARLYQKPNGTFFVRVLIPARTPATDGAASARRPKRAELRRSLWTTDVVEARKISSSLNARLEGVEFEMREQVATEALEERFPANAAMARFQQAWNAAKAAETKTAAPANGVASANGSRWSLPGIEVDGHDAARSLSAFLNEHPQIRDAVALRIAGGAANDATPTLPRLAGLTAMGEVAPLDPPHSKSSSTSASAIEVAPPVPAPLALSPEPEVVQAAVGPAISPMEPPLVSIVNASPAVAPQVHQVAPHVQSPVRSREAMQPQVATALTAHVVNAFADQSLLPRQPIHLDVGITKYLAHFRVAMKAHCAKTTDEKERLLHEFQKFVRRTHPELGDVWVHQIDSGHVQAFLTEQAVRPGREDAGGQAKDVAPATMIKKLGNMNHFFAHMKSVKATREDIPAELEQMGQIWRQQIKGSDRSYRPFTDDHIRTIFEPRDYLAANRKPDYFWLPLLGLFLGVRLGDLHDADLSAFGYDAAIDVHYVDVKPEDAKNANSIRRLPIVQPLIDIGFIDYVQRIRSMGATKLFPDRDLSKVPDNHHQGKNPSRQFGEYLDKIGLTDRKLVFHSFRHTVVTALQDAGVPLHVSMQLVGHEAQEHAIRIGAITAEQARSVHMGTYSHATEERMGIQHPLLTMKQEAERAIRPPIDIDRTRKAAEIVTRHVKPVGGGFRTGWAGQMKDYTAKMCELV